MSNFLGQKEPMSDATLHPARRLLRKAHDPDKADAIFDEKVRKKPLHLIPGEPDTESKDARSARRRQRLRKKEHYLRHRKPRPLSAKERRRLAIHDIPDDPPSRKWDTYVPLRDLWLAYMREILDIRRHPSGKPDTMPFFTAASAGPKLASADYHGAELEVVRSNCISRVGVRGIVLKDTKFTFELITPNDQIRIIPKNQTIFRFQVPFDTPDSDGPESQSATAGSEMQITQSKSDLKPFVFEIHGSQFEFRPADRANKKFKQKRMDLL